MTRPSDTEAVTLTDDEGMTLVQVLRRYDEHPPTTQVCELWAAVASILAARLAGAAHHDHETCGECNHQRTRARIEGRDAAVRAMIDADALLDRPAAAEGNE